MLILQLPPLPPHVQKSMEANGGQMTGPNAFQTPTSVANRSLPSTENGGDTNASPLGTTTTESDDHYIVPGIPASTGHTFGVDLGEQLVRDGLEIPLVMQKCAEAIEAYGKLLFPGTTPIMILLAADVGRNREYGHISFVRDDEPCASSETRS